MIYLPKWLPWKRKNEKTVVPTYEFVDVYQYEQSDETHAGIRILDGPYKGLLYAYRTVKMVPDPENDRCHLKFDWVPFENAPENDTADLQDVLGDILVDIIERDMSDKD